MVLRDKIINSTPTPLSLWRIATIFLLYIVVGLLLLVKLFDASVTRQTSFIAEAEEQQIGKRILTASRGDILVYDAADRSSTFSVARNVDTYSLSVIPRHVVNIDEVANGLFSNASIPKNEILDLFNKNKDKFYLSPIRKGLSQELANKIEALNLKGVELAKEQNRFYPEKKLAAQIIGFVDGEGNGKYGVEGTFDKYLNGQSGEETGQKDISGKFIGVSESKSPQNGANYVLTLDRNVQFTVEEKLHGAIEKFQADSGSAIVMDPQTGEILAMANEPSFDLNEFNKVPVENHSIFTNESIAGIWEPGSVIKPIIIAAALDSGSIDENYQGNYSNFVVVQGHEIHTATDKAFGKETVTQVLENSDNVAMVDIGNKVGNSKMRDYLVKFGFGEKLGFDLKGEASGKLLALKDWRDINRATMSFGQGISVTPIQMASAYGVIANGGKLVVPHVVKEVRRADGKVDSYSPNIKGDVISKDTTQKVTKMLVSVVERGHGKKAAVSGYSVAGKTGTAQIPKPDGGYEEDKHIGSFAGFVPASNPKFVILVKLDNPKTVEFAESSAAPTFSEIASFLLSYYRVQPDR